MKRSIKVKRVYAPPQRSDGCRVLVDGLWPRGLSKSSARIDLWLKEIAPSGTLRKWFGHDPSRWSRFRARYFRELQKTPEATARLDELIRKGTVTLLFAAKEEEHNNAVALKEYLMANGQSKKESNKKRSSASAIDPP